MFFVVCLCFTPFKCESKTEVETQLLCKPSVFLWMAVLEGLMLMLALVNVTFAPQLQGFWGLDHRSVGTALQMIFIVKSL